MTFCPSVIEDSLRSISSFFKISHFDILINLELNKVLLRIFWSRSECWLSISCVYYYLAFFGLEVFLLCLVLFRQFGRIKHIDFELPGNMHKI